MLGTTKQAEVRDVLGVRGKGLVGLFFTQLDDCSFLVHDELRAGSMREAIAAAGGVSRADVGTMQDTYVQDLNKNLSLVAKNGSEDSLPRGRMANFFKQIIESLCSSHVAWHCCCWHCGTG